MDNSNDINYYFFNLLEDYKTVLQEQNLIKNNFLSLYTILFDIEFIKHKKVIKDDNETYVRQYEFQRNLKQALHFDIPDDEFRFFAVKRLDEICTFNSGTKIDANYVNVFDKIFNKRNRNDSSDRESDDSSNELSKSSPERVGLIPHAIQYPVHGSETDKRMDSYNRENFNIIINKNRPDIDLTVHKLYLDDNYLTVHLKEENELLHKYIGYYILNRLDDIYIHLGRGIYKRQFDLNELKSMRIVVPLNENHILKTIHDCTLFYNDMNKLNIEIRDNNNMLLFWSNIDKENVTQIEINKIKLEIEKCIKDNISNRKNLKKFKSMVYNEFLQQPLEENL